MASHPRYSNPLLFEAMAPGRTHDYHFEVRLATNGSRYLRLEDKVRGRRGEEEKRAVVVFEEIGPDF